MGESPALAVAIPAAGKTVGAVAMPIGPVGWVVIGAVAVVGVGIALYNHTKASAKAKEQTEQEQTPDANAIRFQVQVGSETSASVVKTSQDKNCYAVFDDV